MAVERSSKEKKKQAGGGGGSFGFGWGKGKVFRVIFVIAIVLVVGLCLFGIINQRVMGTSFIGGFVKVGDEIGKTMYHVFGNDAQSPTEYGPDGIYLKGHSPEKNSEEEKKAEEEKQKQEQEHKENVQNPNKAN